MGAIIDKITEFLKEMLQGWVLDNLTGMFGFVNDEVSNISGEVSQTPSSWNGTIFNMVTGLSNSVILPIAGIIITYVLIYELITMVMEKNNFHDFDSSLFFRYLFKACIAVVIVSNTSNIVLAIFDVGNSMVNSAGAAISGNTAINVETTLINLFNSQIATMEIGELVALGLETMIVKLCMMIMSVLITVILYGRMIEIYLYVSVAPIPFATFANREWGGIGNNYGKGLFALALQGFFIMVCVGIYAALVGSIATASNLHYAIWRSAGYSVILCFSLFKTGSLAKSILNAH